MSSKPILFNTEMVKAILDGIKTQFRLPIKNITIYELNKNYIEFQDMTGANEIYSIEEFMGKASQYKANDILYIQEDYFVIESEINYKEECVVYKKDLFMGQYTNLCRAKDNRLNRIDWISAENMPKEYARIFSKVTNVRVERLQDILREDALKEVDKSSWLCESLNMYPNYEDHQKGFNDIDYDLKGKDVNGAICSFRTLWNSTAKDGYKWEDNPYVFVYEFERIKKQ